MSKKRTQLRNVRLQNTNPLPPARRPTPPPAPPSVAPTPSIHNKLDTIYELLQEINETTSVAKRIEAVRLANAKAEASAVVTANIDSRHRQARRISREETIQHTPERDGWISVDDRLPKTPGEYLVVIYEEGVDVFCCRWDPRYAKWKGIEATDEGLDHVTHWMPFPSFTGIYVPSSSEYSPT